MADAEDNQIDQAVEQFREQILLGHKPDIAAALAAIDSSLRSRLLKRLIVIDAEHRQLQGEAVFVADYRHLDITPSDVEECIGSLWCIGGHGGSNSDSPTFLPGSGSRSDIDAPTLMSGSKNDLPSDGPDSMQSKERSGEIKLSASEATSVVSKSIGPYRLLRKLGEGGMGSVWMAEQEWPVRRQVALKLIKTGLDNKQVIARFEAERQALAMMNHENIAKVLDGGTTSEGSPFFVMELVKGVSLTQYCDQNRLSINERLELFIPVCKAVQHAHQKGVIHRDLKPSNVMVSLEEGRPVPKVIDFGLAKALQQQTMLTDKTMFTEFGQVVGTLQYMSPEQAEMTQMDIDTRTDVYSLGVILYEILTGTTPITRETLKQQAVLKVLESIREQDPPRPSDRLSSVDRAVASSVSEHRRIEPLRLKAILKGELDWIVMKAIEKDRSRRYETANAFAKDISNFLSGDVVNARPTSRRYRIGKFIRKNRVQVTAAALLLLTLLGGIVGTSYGLIRANQYATDEGIARKEAQAKQVEAEAQRKLAVLEKKRAEEREQVAINAVRQFGDSIINNPDLKNNPSLEPLRNKLLEEPLAFFTSLRTRLEEDGSTSSESLAKLARAVSSLGDLNYEIGNRKHAAEAYSQNSAIWERLVRENPEVVEFQSRHAESRNNLANLQHDLGKTTDALLNYKLAIEIHEKLAKKDPQNLAYSDNLAKHYTNISKVLMDTGKSNEALTFSERSLEIFQRLADEHPDQYRAQVASVHTNTGNILGMTGKSVEALLAYEKARKILEPLVDEKPTIEQLDNLSANYTSTAFLLIDLGKPTEAAPFYQKALDISERLTSEVPTSTAYRSKLAGSHNNLGTLFKAIGEYEKALKAYEQALSIHNRLRADNPKVGKFQYDAAGGYINIGHLLNKNGTPDQAMNAYEKGAEILDGLIGSHPDVTEYRDRFAQVHETIGVSLNLSGRFIESEKSLNKALQLSQKLVSDNPTIPDYRSRLAGVHGNIGLLLVDMQRPMEARLALEESIEIQSILCKEQPEIADHQHDMAGNHVNIGLIHQNARNWDEAIASYQRAIEIQRPLAIAHPNETLYQTRLAGSCNNLARCLIEVGNPDDAILAFEQALKTHQSLAEKHPSVPDFRNDVCSFHRAIAEIQQQQGNRSESIKAYLNALEIAEQLAEEYPEQPDFRSSLGGTLNDLAYVETQDGQYEEAKDHLRQAIQHQKFAISKNSDHPKYRLFLKNHFSSLNLLGDQLKQPDLVREAQVGLAELAASDPNNAAKNDRLRLCDSGGAEAKAEELLDLGRFAYDTLRYSLATRMYAKALRMQPDIANDRKAQVAYNAACCAVLTARGDAIDEPNLDAPARTRLRETSLEWLQLELKQWDTFLAEHPDQSQSFHSTLQHWQRDNDLQSVRDMENLDKLPETERDEWKRFWQSVEIKLSTWLEMTDPKTKNK